MIVYRTMKESFLKSILYDSSAQIYQHQFSYLILNKIEGTCSTNESQTLKRIVCFSSYVRQRCLLLYPIFENQHCSNAVLPKS